MANFEETGENEMISYTKKDPLFEYIHFVARAVSKDPTRPALCCLYVSEGKIVGSNGHRLHISNVKPKELNDGFYRVYKITKTIVDLDKQDNISQTYPNYKAILDSRESKGQTYKANSKDSTSIHSTLARKHNIYINLKYIEAALPALDSVTLDNENSPVFFRSGALLAILMPIRIKDVFEAEEKEETR